MATVASATRLKLRHWCFLPIFIYKTFLITSQLTHSSGFLRGRILTDKNLTFWTLTLWQDKDSMRIFRNSGHHLSVMPKLQQWCNEATIATWLTEDEDLPAWNHVYEQIKIGKAVPLRFASLNQTILDFAVPNQNTRLQLNLRPKR